MAHLVRLLRSKFRRRRGEGRAGERPGAALVFLRRHSSTCKTETRAPATTGEHRPGRPLPQGRSTRGAKAACGAQGRLGLDQRATSKTSIASVQVWSLEELR